MIPPLKKIKTASTLSEIESSTSSIARSVERAYEKAQDGYIVDIVKKRHEYNNKDLPVPVDSRWSKSFISTVTLWCSTRPNVWNIPDEELTVALQLVFNAVYPDIKYCVTITGSVFSVVSLIFQYITTYTEH